MSEEKGFLSRWSERKRQVAVEEAEAESQSVSPVEPAPDPYEGKSDEEILAELALPEPESLKLGDRVEAFMSPEVPERIRARALRAFWRTNPILANVDGLDDYCDDFTDAAFAVENIQTIYEVGKGYAQQALDALEKLAEEAPDAVDAPLALAQPADDSVAESSGESPLALDQPVAEEDALADQSAKQDDEVVTGADTGVRANQSQQPRTLGLRRMHFKAS